MSKKIDIQQLAGILLAVSWLIFLYFDFKYRQLILNVINIGLEKKTNFPVSGVIGSLFEIGLGVLVCFCFLKAKSWARVIAIVLSASACASFSRMFAMFGGLPQAAWLLGGLFFAFFIFFWRSNSQDQYLNRGSVKLWRWIPWVYFGLVIMNLLGPWGIAYYWRNKLSVPHTEKKIKYQKDTAVPQGFRKRELFDFVICVPERTHICGMDKGLLVLQLANKTGYMIINNEISNNASYNLAVAKLTGDATPYEAERRMMTSRWSLIPTLVQMRVFSTLELKQFQSLQRIRRWKGFGMLHTSSPVENKEEKKLVAEYTIYSVDNPLKTVGLTWHVKQIQTALKQGEIEQAMGVFDFVNVNKPVSEYLSEARKALKNSRWLDAQFALAQAYLLGERDKGVLIDFVEVSERLESWMIARQLVKELRNNDPKNSKIKELYTKAFDPSNSGKA